MASKPPTGSGRLGAVVGSAGAAAMLVATVAAFEGRSNDPYWDHYAKIWTVCYGETRVEMRHYTTAECDDQLANGLADFAGPVLAIDPELRGHPNQITAATSFAYNAGITNYRRSTVSRDFRAGKWKAACNALLAWNRSGGKVVAGLTNRRRMERDLCLRDLP